MAHDWPGYGAGTVGGQGGIIIRVTKLRDSGPDSLRAALEYAGRRIVWVCVSGYIDLLSDIIVTNPYVTLYVDPAHMIATRYYEVRWECHQYIGYNLRGYGTIQGNIMRAGDQVTDPPGPVYSQGVLFKCALLYSTDDQLTVRMENFSAIRCILGNGFLTGSKGAAVREGAVSSTFWECLFPNNLFRNPRVRQGLVEVLRCIIHNPATRAMDVQPIQAIFMNIIRCVLTYGVDSGGTETLMDVMFSSDTDAEEPYFESRIHIADCDSPLKPVEYRPVELIAPFSDWAAIAAAMFIDTPNEMTQASVDALASVDDLMETLLPHIGPVLDDPLTLAIKDAVRNSTGQIAESIAAYGELYEIESGYPPMVAA